MSPYASLGVGRTVLEMGKSEIIIDGKDLDLAFIAVGNAVYPALKAAAMLKKEDIDACVVNARFIKPLDEEGIRALCGRTKRIITVEENLLAGGFGSAVLEFLNREGIYDVAVHRIGIDDEFVEHGSQALLRKQYGLDEDGIYRAATAFLKISSHPAAY